MFFREMTSDDVNSVFTIEKKSYPFPWSKSLFEAAVLSTKYCTVAELDGVIVGYGIISFVVGEAELLNLCVDPDFQGKGIANELLTHLLDYAANLDNHEMFLEVRVSNAAAIHLYEKLALTKLADVKLLSYSRRKRRCDSNGSASF